MPVMLYATFSEAAAAEKALAALLDRGAEGTDLSALFPQRHGKPSETNQQLVQQALHGVSTTTAADALEGARKGAVFGLGVGTALGLLSLLIPGVGLVTGGGALATALTGVAGSLAAGAVAGGVAGYLEDQGVCPEVARAAEAAIGEGKTVVYIACPSGDLNQEQIRELLAKYGADGFRTAEVA